MNREECISLLNKEYNDGISVFEMQGLIKQYCLDNNKEEDKSEIFSSLLGTMISIHPFYDTARQYYIDKFKINRVIEDGITVLYY